MKIKLLILLLFLLSNNILSSESAPQNGAENASMKIVIAKVLSPDEIKYLGEDNAKKLVESILKTAFPKLRAEQFKESFWSKIKEWLAKVTGNQTSNQKKLDEIKKSVRIALQNTKEDDNNIVKNALEMLENEEKFQNIRGDTQVEWLKEKKELIAKIDTIISRDDAMAIAKLAVTAAKQMIDDRISTQAAQVQPSSTTVRPFQEADTYKLNFENVLEQLKNEAAEINTPKLSAAQEVAAKELAQKVTTDIEVVAKKRRETISAEKAKPVLAEAANIYHENQHPTTSQHSFTSQHPPISQHSLVPSAVPSVHNLPHVV